MGFHDGWCWWGWATVQKKNSSQSQGHSLHHNPWKSTKYQFSESIRWKSESIRLLKKWGETKLRKIPAISFGSTQKPHHTPDLLSLFTKAPLLINERESYKVRPPSDVSWFWTHEYYSYTPPINRSRAVMCVNSALIWAAYIPYYISQQKTHRISLYGGVLKYGYPEIIYRYKAYILEKLGVPPFFPPIW